MDDQALYSVSSQIDVRKHVQSSGFDSLLRSSSRSLKIWKQIAYSYENLKHFVTCIGEHLLLMAYLYMMATSILS